MSFYPHWNTEEVISEIAHLLQVKLFSVWHVPFHFAGGGPKPSSLKLSDSGQIPTELTKFLQFSS